MEKWALAVGIESKECDAAVKECRSVFIHAQDQEEAGKRAGSKLSDREQERRGLLLHSKPRYGSTGIEAMPFCIGFYWQTPNLTERN